MDRLTKEQWLAHGLTSLANDGFTSLKADKLVKSLGVSRGSFYWHFKNLADFHAAVVARWQTTSVTAVIQMLEESGEVPPQKLTKLISIAVRSEPALERAIRAWALNDAKVKQAVQDADSQCLGYLQQLLEEIGIDEQTAAVRARLIYGGYVGQVMLGDPLSDAQQTGIIEELIELAVRNVRE